jgi:hypothetical protein
LGTGFSCFRIETSGWPYEQCSELSGST